MSERETDEGLQFHVEDLREPATEGERRPGSRPLPDLPHLARSPRDRLVRRAAAVVTLALVVVVALAGIPAVRQGALDLLHPPAPNTAGSAGAESNAFFFVPSPPGVDVLLDGHALSRQPLVGDPHPLVLSRGHHTLTWRSSRLPFQPLSCVVSIPANPAGDTCPLAPAPSGPGTRASPGSAAGSVVTLHPSLARASDALLANTLRPEGAGLLTAVWDALDAVQYDSVVQSGEHYALDAPTPRIVTATEPLRATLSYTPNSLYDEPCTVASGILPCRFPDQDCSLLCTVSAPLAAQAGYPGEWIVGAGVHSAWTYTALDGRVVAQNVSDPIGVRLVLLRIAWDGSKWHVTPLAGHIASLPASDDAACDAALILMTGTTWAFMVTDPPPGASLEVASGAAPGDGCVLVVAHHGTPPPTFLERYGVLLTVNGQAVNAQDELPMANAEEQALARQLMAPLQL